MKADSGFKPSQHNGVYPLLVVLTELDFLSTLDCGHGFLLWQFNMVFSIRCHQVDNSLHFERSCMGTDDGAESGLHSQEELWTRS